VFYVISGEAILQIAETQRELQSHIEESVSMNNINTFYLEYRYISTSENL